MAIRYPGAANSGSTALRGCYFHGPSPGAGPGLPLGVSIQSRNQQANVRKLSGRQSTISGLVPTECVIDGGIVLGGAGPGNYTSFRLSRYAFILRGERSEVIADGAPYVWVSRPLSGGRCIDRRDSGSLNQALCASGQANFIRALILRFSTRCRTG